MNAMIVACAYFKFYLKLKTVSHISYLFVHHFMFYLQTDVLGDGAFYDFTSLGNAIFEVGEEDTRIWTFNGTIAIDGVCLYVHCIHFLCILCMHNLIAYLFHKCLGLHSKIRGNVSTNHLLRFSPYLFSPHDLFSLLSFIMKSGVLSLPLDTYICFFSFFFFIYT